MIDVMGGNVLLWAWMLLGASLFFEPHVQSYANVLLTLHSERAQQELHTPFTGLFFLQRIRHSITVLSSVIVVYLCVAMVGTLVGYYVYVNHLNEYILVYASQEVLSIVESIIKNTIRLVLVVFLFQLIGVVDISHPLRTYTFWRHYIQNGAVNRPRVEQYIQCNPRTFTGYVLTWVAIFTHTWRSTWGYGVALVIYCVNGFPFYNYLGAMIAGFFLGLLVWRIGGRYRLAVESMNAPLRGTMKVPLLSSVKHSVIDFIKMIAIDVAKIQLIGFAFSRMIGIVLLALCLP